jgi:hypothetical protein
MEQRRRQPPKIKNSFDGLSKGNGQKLKTKMEELDKKMNLQVGPVDRES